MYNFKEKYQYYLNIFENYADKQKEIFKQGLTEMIKRLEPTDVLVHGYMPDAVFKNLEDKTNFHRYPSLFEQTHPKEECA